LENLVRKIRSINTG